MSSKALFCSRPSWWWDIENVLTEGAEAMVLQRTSVMSISLVILIARASPLLSHSYLPFSEKGEVTYEIPSEWTLLPTRLRKLFAPQCTPHVRLLVPVI